MWSAARECRERGGGIVLRVYHLNDNYRARDGIIVFQAVEEGRHKV